MESRLAKTKIGIIVVIALAIVIFAILWGKNISFTSEREEYRISFPSVTGLERSAQVLVNGLPSGKVTGFELRSDRVIVDIELDREVEVYTDAFAREPLPEGEIIFGRPQFSYAQVVSSVAEVGKKVNTTLDEINKTIGELHNILTDPALDRSMQNLASTTDELSLLISNSRRELNSILVEMSEITQNVSTIIDTNDSRIDTTMKNLAVLSTELRTTAARLDTFAVKLNDPENTVGRMLTSDELYNQLLKTMEAIDNLANHIREEGIKTDISIF